MFGNLADQGATIMRINTEDDGVFETTLTMEQIRECTDEQLSELLGTVLDEAQGYVFSDNGPKAFVVIKVTK